VTELLFYILQQECLQDFQEFRNKSIIMKNM